MISPYPFQEKGISWLCRKPVALLADDMGLGKTIQVVEALKRLRIKNGLIICPLSVRHSWIKWLRQQYGTVFLREIKSKNVLIDYNSINVITYDVVWKREIVQQISAKPDWQILVCDESHYLKNRSSKRTRVVLSHIGLHRFFKWKWMVTGTPVLNRPVELYPMLRALIPELMMQYKDFYKYAYRFCAAYQSQFGFDATGASHLDELSRLISPVMLRRTKEQVLTDLPSITYDKVYLDPTDALVKLCTAEMEAKTTEVASIRQSIGLLKTKPALDHIATILESKQKLVVYAYHTAVINVIKEAYPNNAVLYTGAESVEEKQNSVQMFQQDPNTKLFIGQIRAAGVGLDGLQDVCDTCLFVELVYTPGEILQAIDRLRRIGQKKAVSAQFLVVENSEEERIVDILCQKSQNINTILREEGREFVEIPCSVCRKFVSIGEIKRVLNMNVCAQCVKNMSVFV